jgi:serine protease Do
MTQTNLICRRVLRIVCVTASMLALSSSQDCFGDEMDSLRRTATVRAIAAAEPAVVNIEGNKPASGARSDSQQVNGMGAGVIIDRRGYILTNQHVVQDVGRIEVTLSSGRQYVGRLIDRDPATDLALIKIDTGRHLPVIKCGTSSDLLLGEPVIAIGNPYGYHHSVTQGIISALKRDIPVNGVQEYPDLIQTDASINPGNSGGPLLNAKGDMIGINAAVRIGAQGIGFAIPVDRAIKIAASMISRHRERVSNVDAPFKVRTSYEGGRSIVSVISSSSTELQTGDVIQAINNQPIRNQLDLELTLLDHSQGSTLNIDCQRGSQNHLATVTLGRGNAVGNSSVRLASSSSTAQAVWTRFGMRLEHASASDVQSVDTAYKGGFKITAVRRGSPAHEAQLQEGDILVGLMEWQSPQWSELIWIMNRSELKNASKVRFHIMRGSEIYWGELER